MILRRRDPAARGLRDTIRVLPPAVRLILASMVVFNIGFYLVVPFLAVHLSENLALAGWAVGLVLGLRTFSQQGLFFLGGGLADRFGVRRMVLLGVAVRVVGFLLLGLADDLASVLVAVLLVGVAAALFAPAVESANAAYGHRLETDGVLPRTELFAIEQMCSRLGSVLGPALGALLLAVPFGVTSAAAAGLFALLWVAFLRWLPADASTGTGAGGEQRSGTVAPTLQAVWGTVLRNRPFLVFTVLCGAQLVAYNQLYLMLPEQLDRAVGGQAALGWFFTGAALLVIGGQRTVTAVAARLGHRVAIVGGLALIAVSFLVPPMLTGSAVVTLAGLACWVLLLHLGQMLMVPPMRDVIARLAGERLLGAHFGMLNTLGGGLTLIGALAVGAMYDGVDAGIMAVGTPWWALAATVAVAAGALWTWSRGRPLSPAAAPG
ncbi:MULTISPECIES: MFS transporter [Pseudonocardia]|uniref:Multidrug resistance protein MdtH n=2 Tax=Pseudonocardia TaxID=1847 RepID=A0A1Y2N6N1_PSEAH|nr:MULTISPECIES: MFS transporter [Pseudonocardia]OSY43120.1 Multidrug resistance protein MdtH [Pseudonocardia autotrophica]TDN71608.1 MFS transporter [Pseudonocardia autotrophica]BBG02295.1 MFS transporter [Pseudonocardia autotrophica]GEC23369.1 MFS transporter [Pseudonocardia saturnea]